MPNIARLQQLLDHVTSLPMNKINMNCWANGLNINECGTAACLGGHATTLFPNEIILTQDTFAHRRDPGYGIKHLLRSDTHDSDALRIVFDLDEEEEEDEGDGPEVDLLFSGGRTPERAIQDLEKFIADNS